MKTKDVKNLAKCVDDAVLWASSMEEAFHQVCDFLTLVGRNGIVMNPAKYVFNEGMVEFAGFEVTEEGGDEALQKLVEEGGKV